jgi:hypothetical protein
MRREGGIEKEVGLHVFGLTAAVQIGVAEWGAFAFRFPAFPRKVSTLKPPFPRRNDL